jgi:hypothetical protein
MVKFAKWIEGTHDDVLKLRLSALHKQMEALLKKGRGASVCCRIWLGSIVCG